MTTLVGIISIISMMLVSLLIVNRVKNKHKTNFDAESDIFLFHFNTLKLSISSNTGTLFSLSLYCAGSFYFGYKTGLNAIYAIAISTFIAGLLLYIIVKIKSDFLWNKNRKIISAYVGEKLGIETQALLVVIVCFYSVIIIGCELFLFKEFLIETLYLNGLEAITISLCCLAICYYYTKAGGFLGVLKTDLVQLAVVVIWLGFSIFLVLQMNIIDRIGIDIFHTTVDAKSENNSGGYPFFHQPLLLVIGSCVYILTLLLNCLGIWTRSFGTLKKANERMYSAILSTFLITILMMIPIGFGVCFNGLETGWQPFQLFFKVMKSLTGRSIFYSFLTTLAFTAIVITTIDSLLISSLQEVNRLNKKNDPSFRRQLLSQNSLMLSIIIVAGSISILLNYEYLFVILLIIYNINMLAFILIFHSLFQTETVSNWFEEKGMLFDRIFILSKWDNHRSLFAFLVTVVLFAVPLAISDKTRAWSMENFYILPFFVYFSFAFLNIIFKIERTKHG